MENKNYHFIGIGGIGMSALAKILLQKNQIVSGSDLKKSSITSELEKMGANIQIGHKSKNVDENKTIIISSAIDEKNEEFLKAKKLHLNIIHRSDLLNILMNEKKPLLVTGTHGKTTTTSLLTSVLLQDNLDPSFVIGGILLSHNTNGYFGKSKYFVAEADESDGSFLKTEAFGAIVTNLEEEHLNYWKNFENLKNGFLKFFSKNLNKENLFWCKDDKNLNIINPQGISYGFSKEADLKILSFKIFENFKTCFDIIYKGKHYKDIVLNLIGKHNVLNAASVFGLCINLNIDEKVIRKAFENFSGVSRRQQKILEHQKTSFFDDYGHHPTEIENTVLSFKNCIKERKLIAVFQPHRYSRLKDLLQEFSKCFDYVDELIITDIYSANENPIQNISEKTLVELIQKRNVDVKHIKDDLLQDYILKHVKPFDVVVAFGAGDISLKIRKIAENFSKKTDKKIKVGIIYGGISNEHDVSKMSCKNYITGFNPSLFELKFFKITKNGFWIFEKDGFLTSVADQCPKDLFSNEVLKELKSVDICFPIMHGPFCEDGTFAGFLDTLKIPYIGSNQIGAAVSMNKAICKHIAKANNIKTGSFYNIDQRDWKVMRDEILDKILKNLKFPLYVKPNHLGSSIGIKCVKNESELEASIDYILKFFDNSLIVEKEILGREIQTAVIGNEYIIVGDVGEIFTNGKFFDYNDKYLKAGVLSNPSADLDEKIKDEIKSIAKNIYKLCDLSGFARIDFFLTNENEVFFNEINPIPGFSSKNSLFPKMLEKANISLYEMIENFAVYALHKSRNNKKLIRQEI
ncbi:MAG: UDP-N-acetylmuramate--L-alanine ligase [Parachlamydiales bacterium]|nr:UDP-N-acetylmuramate--L-alanine ligase [Parachlamydiales bacterium]